MEKYPIQEIKCNTDIVNYIMCKDDEIKDTLRPYVCCCYPNYLELYNNINDNTQITLCIEDNEGYNYPCNSAYAYTMSDYYLNLGKILEVYEEESNNPSSIQYHPQGIIINEDDVRNNIKKLLNK